ncbi:MAG: MBL fold metallo-hydrolase [Armatimonadetes bacterium]|nr:MBL fold metallo-hydrolase [Armatimonadota bacterium]
MPILRYNLGPMDNNTYLIVDSMTNEVALVDPTFDSETIWEEIQESGYTLRYVLNTHAHFDHIIGNAYFLENSSAILALHRNDLGFLHQLPVQAQMFGFSAKPSPEPSLFLEEGQTLMLGSTPIEVRFTPGHAPGHVTFLVEGAAIVGDCLFQGSIGRTDLPQSSLQTLMHSIQIQLLTLPDGTPVYPGHGAPTTIGEERRHNPFLQEWK